MQQLVLSSVNGTALAKGNSDIKIRVNHVEKKAEVKPQIKDGSVYVPVRTIFNELGIDFIFVPLRLIGETFGANITWDKKTQSVVIITDKKSSGNTVQIPKESEIKDYAACWNAPNDLDLLRSVANHSDIHVPMIERLIGLGLNPNSAVPESISLDAKGAIRFGTIGKSNVEGVKTPIVVQSYYVTSWEPTDENMIKFATLIRNGGSLALFTESQKKHIAELIKDKPAFSDIYTLVAQ